MNLLPLCRNTTGAVELRHAALMVVKRAVVQRQKGQAARLQLYYDVCKGTGTGVAGAEELSQLLLAGGYIATDHELKVAVVSCMLMHMTLPALMHTKCIQGMK